MGFLIAVPVHNEERHVERVLADVAKYAENILVIDDGSTDSTPELLERVRGIEVITHSVNQGYGAGIIEALRYACRFNYQYTITLDADEQHSPQQIPELMAAAPMADIVSGSRYMLPCPDCDLPPASRRAINARITKLINELTGYRLTDAFCGFKCYRVKPMCELNLNEPGYGMPLQLWLQAAKHGLTVREIPVRIVYHDPSRRFGGGLDDDDARLRYYLEVIEREKQSPPPPICTCRKGRCGSNEE